MNQKNDHYVLFSIILLGLVNVLLFFVGFYASDDMGYLYGINTLGLQGQLPDMSYLGPSRWGVIFPNALIVSLFGANKLSYFLIYFHMGFYYIGTSILAYLIFRKLAGRLASLMGASLILLNPIYYKVSASILPDTAMAFYLTLALYILIRIDLKGHRHLGAFVLLSGIVVGMAYACKESALLAVPIFFIYFIVFMKSAKDFFRRLVLFSLGLVIPLIIDVGFIYQSTGKVNLRITGAVQSQTSVQALEKRRREQGVMPLERIEYSLSVINSDWKGIVPVTGAILFISFLLVFFFGDRNKKKWALMFLFGFLFFYCYLTIGTLSLHTYRPPPIGHPRYLNFLFIFVGGLLALGLETVLGWKKPGRVLSVSLSLFLLAFLVQTVASKVKNGANLYRSCEVKSFLKANKLVLEKIEGSIPFHLTYYLDYRMMYVKPYFSSLNWDKPLLVADEKFANDFVFFIQQRESPSREDVLNFMRGVAPNFDYKLFSEEPVVGLKSNLSILREYLGRGESVGGNNCARSKGVWVGRATNSRSS